MISVNGKHDFDCFLNQANDFEIPESDLMHLRIKSFRYYQIPLWPVLPQCYLSSYQAPNPN
jgi:hypothetical protein